MVALGTVIIAAVGLGVGLWGGMVTLLLGLALTLVVAIVQYHLLHPGGLYGGPAPWPWGAASLTAYVFGLAIGLFISLARKR